MKRLIQILACLGLAIAGPPAQARDAAQAGAVRAPYRIAILGDRTGLARPGIFEAAIRQANDLKPDLIITVGDLLEGYTSDPAEIGRDWAQAEKMLAASRVPMVLVPGNHDISNVRMLDAWRAHRGPPWFAFVRRKALFLVLDTEDPPMPMPAAMETAFRETARRMLTDPAGAAAAVRSAPPPAPADLAALRTVEQARLSREQVEFVRTTLRKHRNVRWTFVLLHKPAWHGDNAQFREIEQLLADRPYTVIAGHLHRFAQEVRHGRDYIIMGPTGALPPDDSPASADRLGWIEIGQGDPKFSTIPLRLPPAP